jgi:hypothetical protein
MKNALENAGRELAKLYLSLLSLGILAGFPAICFIGLMYLFATAADFAGVRGTLAIVLFFGVPFFVLLFFSIYVSQHTWPATKRLLEEVEKLRQGI